jgi:hypothetical protein
MNAAEISSQSLAIDHGVARYVPCLDIVNYPLTHQYYFSTTLGNPQYCMTKLSDESIFNTSSHDGIF